ncbi:MAG TPA: response regulator, partial [Opitutus sp.]|nr:response regulator [Opitutus sp.]
LAGRRIVVVEDVASTRRALTAVLKGAGADVVAVDSAAAAWPEIEQSRPDLILSDLGLPATDGFALIQQVRATERMRDVAPVPAVALTAFAGEGIEQKARESGFQLCLAKPIQPLRLVKTVASLLK